MASAREMLHARHGRLAVLGRQLGVSYEDAGEPLHERSNEGSNVRQPSQACVVGAMVIDIQAHADAGSCEPGGTVPGRVRQSPGGVGRNVAQALAQLCGPQRQPLLISSVGTDAAGTALLAHWQALGLHTRGILRQGSLPTPTVAFCFHADGSVAAGVADIGSLELGLTAAHIQAFRRELAAAPLVVLEGNMPASRLEAACDAASEGAATLWFEPVSSAKAVRAAGLLHRLHFVSPNAAELAALAAEVRWRQRRRPLPEPPEASEAASQIAGLRAYLQTVLQAGVRHVVLTLGAQGAALVSLAASDKPALQVCHMPALPARLRNTSGAGDCLVAGACMRLLQGGDPVSALAHGMAAAKCAVESDENVPAGLSAPGVRALAAAAEASARTWQLPLLKLE